MNGLERCPGCGQQMTRTNKLKVYVFTCQCGYTETREKKRHVSKKRV